eukprot:364585-Chlamydomonas_euryale.AAC.11
MRAAWQGLAQLLRAMLRHPSLWERCIPNPHGQWTPTGAHPTGRCTPAHRGQCAPNKLSHDRGCSRSATLAGAIGD